MGINRDRFGKIDHTVLREVWAADSPEIVKEEKCCRKPNPFAMISKEAFRALLRTLATTPDAFGSCILVNRNNSDLSESVLPFIGYFMLTPS